MILHVHTDGRVSLEDPDTFTAFAIRAPHLERDAVLAAFGADARPGEDNHVWVSLARLHLLGEEFGAADWRLGCDQMIEFAESKGWVSAAGDFVRAHIEPTRSASV